MLNKFSPDEILISHSRVISAMTHMYEKKLNTGKLKAYVTQTLEAPHYGDYLVLVDNDLCTTEGYTSVFVENYSVDDANVSCFNFSKGDSSKAVFLPYAVKIAIPLDDLWRMGLRFGTHSGVFEFDWELYLEHQKWNDGLIEEMLKRIEAGVFTNSESPY